MELIIIDITVGIVLVGFGVVAWLCCRGAQLSKYIQDVTDELR